MNKKVLIALPLALMLTVGLTACGSKTPSGDKEPDKVVEYVDKDYVDVTAIGGTIKGKEYSHDKIEKNQNVTIVAPAAIGTQRFDGWYNGNEKVSSEAEYTFQATEHITLTARYDGNTLSVWDGEYPETVSNQATTAADGGYVADFENKTWHITSAAGLAYWAKLVNCEESGNPTYASYRFSAFDAGVYNITSGSNADKVNAAYVPSNAWTLSLECDIDLNNQEWNPIWLFNSVLYDFTFDGNGHTISNLYAQTKGHLWNGGAAHQDGAAGFFGIIHQNDFTIRDITFENALITNGMDGSDYTDPVKTEYPNGNRHCGVVAGFVSGGSTNTYFGRQNISLFENVNVINSFVGGSAVTKSGFLVGRTGQGADDSMFLFKNCNVSDSTIIGFTSIGGMIGHAFHLDDPDIKLGGRISVIESECSVTNVVAINVSDAKDKIFGSLGDAWASTESANVAREKNVSRVALNLGSAWRPAGGYGWTGAKGRIAINSNDLLYLLNPDNADSAQQATNMALVCRDMELTAEQLENIDGETVVIYVLEGVELTLPEGHGFTIYTLKTSEVDSDGYAAVYEGETKKGIFNNGLVLPEVAE